jgi:hypothetical protein
MKTIRFTLITGLLVCLFAGMNAQPNQSAQLLAIHEDQVMVGKTAEYTKASEGLVKLMKENNFQGLTFVAFWLEDNTFMYVSWLDNMAQLDKNPWQELSQLAGEEKTDAVMSAFGGTYNTHVDYIAHFHPELSYKAEQLQEEGNIYREWDYFYYNEINQDRMMELAKEWKKLYEDNNLDIGYTVYSNGFGHEGPVLVIHRWAKDPVDMAERAQKTNQVLGDAAQQLWERTQALGYRIATRRGWLLPNLSNMPSD